ELVQLALGPGADALELPLGRLARGERLRDLGDAIGDDQSRADGNVNRALGGAPGVRDAAVAHLAQALADLRAVGASLRAVGASGAGAAPRRVGGGSAVWHLSCNPLGGSYALNKDPYL